MLLTGLYETWTSQEKGKTFKRVSGSQPDGLNIQHWFDSSYQKWLFSKFLDNVMGHDWLVFYYKKLP